MNLSTAMWAWGLASAFTLWPMIGKSLQVSGPWVSAIVILMSTVAGLGLAYGDMHAAPVPDIKKILILCAAGILNGAAFYYYGVKANDPAVATGQFAMALILMMVIMTAVFDWVFNGTVLTSQQWLGLGLAIVAIWLIAK
jgi:drug/metabolite transporter (DMT)-like permease